MSRTSALRLNRVTSPVHIIRYITRHRQFGMYDYCSLDDVLIPPVKGPDRADTAVWCRLTVSTFVVCDHRRCHSTSPFLALATTVSQFLGQIREHPGDSQRCVIYTTCRWYQLLRMVRDWVCIPVPCAKAELCLVEQVQLRY